MKNLSALSMPASRRASKSGSKSGRCAPAALPRASVGRIPSGDQKRALGGDGPRLTLLRPGHRVRRVFPLPRHKETPMPHLDTGNTGFMLLCSSLVMLMTPGLAFFYGGLVGRRNVLTIMMQSFVSMGLTTVLWWICGFSLCFSGDLKSGTDLAGIVGNFDWAFLRNITLATPSPNEGIPMLVFCAYQMMFAIITPALITGAFTNRVTFKAYMLFLTAWLLCVYFPFVHMV